jgi:hypothetical protein
MPTDFRVFRERLAEAYRIRGMTHDAVCRSIGIGAAALLIFISQDGAPWISIACARLQTGST